MAGYSGTPLIKKLGIKEGMRVVVLHALARYAQILGRLPAGAVLESGLYKSAALIHYFTKNKSALARDFPELKTALLPDGALWISWPEAASKVPTDLSDQVVREIGIENGLVDVKVAAIDETRSGLKFVYRVKDRKK